MQLQETERIARDLLLTLAPYCERIEIAGSVRRRKPQVKDLEIVYISRVDAIAFNTLFAVETPLIDLALRHLIDAGDLDWDQQVKRNGPKYKRLVYRQQLVVELFAATPQNWGYILALRTGPAEFNQALVSPPWKGGIKPLDVSFVDGVVHRNGQPVDVPDERAFFDLFNLPVIDPAARDAEIILRKQL